MTKERCEQLEPEISAMLDGEVTASETLAIVDHLLQCDHCRTFYRGGRSLARALDTALLASSDTALPDTLWKRIEAAARPTGSADSKLVRLPQRPWRILIQVAAVCLLALGAWWLGDTQSSRLPSLPDEGIVQVAVEGKPGAMDETRFLQLTTELLQADRQYHLKMHQILTAVNRQTLVIEGGGEGAAPFSEDAIRRADWSSGELDDRPEDQQQIWY
jgi:hypothetical protein